MKKLHTDNLNYKFSKEIKPLLKIKSGERVKVDTLDCYNELLIDGKVKRSEIDSSKINPISGPIYIDKAYPGDILEIEIEDIEVKDRGVMTSKPGMGLLGNKVELEDSKLIKIKEGKLIFSVDIKLNIDPMIGIIGVAPKGDDVDSSIPGQHGGNLDTKEIKKGAKVYLPVFQEGALLSIGDLHGLMGDGETSGTGLEISGSVTMKMNIIKREDSNLKTNNPVVDLGDNLYFLYSDKDFMKSCEKNLYNVYKYFQEIYPELSFNDLYKLVGISCDLGVSQLVNESVTSKVKVPKKLTKLIIKDTRCENKIVSKETKDKTYSKLTKRNKEIYEKLDR